MNTTEVEQLKRKLETKQSEAVRSLGVRDEIGIETMADSLDQVQALGERDLAVRNLDRNSSMLRLIRGALHRMKSGEYGICVACEEEISLKRLNAVPWAARCISCQELADRQDDDRDDTAFRFAEAA